MWKKWIRRVFIFCQLTLAIYFSATAIRSWNEYPIVTSGMLTCHWFFQTLIFLTVVGLRSIMEVPFPAVSICYQIDSWKWPGIIKAMIKADETNIIEQLYLNDTFLFRSMKDQLQMGILGFKKSQKYERLKGKTTLRLGETILAEDIIDLGKLMHFICFIMSNALDIRNFLEPIEKEYLRHQFIKSSNVNFKEFMCNWYSMNWNATILCNAWNNNQSDLKQKWTEECFGSTECLQIPYQLRKTYIRMHLFKTYINKQNIYDYYISKNLVMVTRFEKIKLLNEAIGGGDNISVFDAWSMLNGDLKEIDGIKLDVIDRQDLDVDTLESFSNLFDQPKIHGNRYVHKYNVRDS